VSHALNVHGLIYSYLKSVCFAFFIEIIQAYLDLKWRCVLFNYWTCGKVYFAGFEVWMHPAIYISPRLIPTWDRVRLLIIIRHYSNTTRLAFRMASESYNGFYV